MSEVEKVKSNSVCTVARVDGGLVFAVIGAGEIRFNPDKVSAENRSRAMYHGFEQRIRDAAAIARNTDTGASATPEEKFAAMQAVADHLMSGATEWSIKRAGGVKEDAGSWVSRALVHLGKAADVTAANDKVIALAEKRFGGEVGKARAALAKAADIAQAILELKAAAIKPDASADDLLGELE